MSQRKSTFKCQKCHEDKPRSEFFIANSAGKVINVNKCAACRENTRVYTRSINTLPSKRKVISYKGRTTTLARVMMEEHLGRELTRKEVVHHINGDYTDDRLDNLEVCNGIIHYMNHKNMR